VNPIVRLIAIEEIRNLKARYFRYIDCKLWDQLPSLFTRDMKVLTPAGDVYSESGLAYAESLRNSLTSAVSVHQGLTAEIEIVDEQNANAIWAMQDMICWDERHPAYGWKSILGRGHYHESYRLEDGAWRIATLTLTRIRFDVGWPEDDPRSLSRP